MTPNPLKSDIVRTEVNPDQPRPVPHPFLYQEWNELASVHWPFDPAIVRPLVPQELALDLYDGKAWVGILPFRATNLHPPLAPPLPWLSTYPEVNVRTYVRGPEGEQGVWFFSLDLARFLAAVGALALTRLPHKWTNMHIRRQGNQVHYKAARQWPRSECPATLRLGIEVGPEIPYPNVPELLLFVSARYRLYTNFYGQLRYGQVEHPRWLLRQARVLYLEQSLLQAAGLPAPDTEPIVCFSEGVSTRLEWLTKTGRPPLKLHPQPQLNLPRTRERIPH